MLGFFHEQSRMDRDKYVKIYWENIMDGKKCGFFSLLDKAECVLLFWKIEKLRRLDINPNQTGLFWIFSDRGGGDPPPLPPIRNFQNI